MPEKLNIAYVRTQDLKPAPYNPRVWDKDAIAQLTESVRQFGLVDPLLVNCATGREGILIGGHFRLKIAEDLGIKEVPVVYINIPDLEKERELNLRLNRNLGAFSNELLADFSQELLAAVGFSSKEMDDIFGIDSEPEQFDLEKELEKIGIEGVTAKKGDLYRLGDHRLLVGDSMIEADVLRLMGGEKADMGFTDPPYILSYNSGGRRHGKPTEGFGAKKNRTYLGLEGQDLPEDFTDLWMANVAKVQKPDFSIIVFENPKNLKTIWTALEKHWTYRNTITWHIPNRVQGFSAKYKFFNKTDVAIVGTGGEVKLNLKPEDDPLFQEEYKNALFATSGKPHWEGYEKGKKICPSDYIEHVAADEKSSGQGIIFGTKPLELLIPYIKVLTKRGDLIVEPFGGSGSTLIAAEKMKRRCYLMEKSPVYAMVIMKRFEKLTGIQPIKL